ncbi:hypothetical protein ACJJTC_004635 [Scirpophaga incertulas]
MRMGGGKSFQHLEAAYLKDPRNVAVWCFGITIRKGVTCDLGGIVKQYRAQAFRTPPKRAQALKGSPDSPERVRVEMKTARQAFCTLCILFLVRASKQGPITVSA